ncbi:putative ATPase/DNA-binding SARP family transcriptional activator [Nocardiopsis mwathae]|uniref:Putative ATPase/DNA-binding SARP family transcriptional activator n=1 Tax=Nocardiopsis mwathae TaxID=1472723 RepID=A0A7W9YN10_9ACTN|nr:BTAD domain-containing putative transcriptional regulator [Nocardiopsis mwathae]MBB6174526.1 putative ATPase/DNA-binding SARP family transcriptional activator [Nocardiopsis mwathae]
MRFGVLGPLTVWTADGQRSALPGTKVRALLAGLLLRRGRVVGADRLVDDLWGDTPPADPAGVLQARVSELRKALEEAGEGGRALVEYRAPGYVLDIPADHVDAGRFEALTEQAAASANPHDRRGLLATALDLWRGPALPEFADADFARAAVARWEERRLTSLEDLAETRLDLGEHGALTAELGALVQRHPFRERLRRAHMRALYRSGRQREALESYAELRTRLADELGLDPGPEAAALHAAILRQDPDLAPPHRTSPAASPSTRTAAGAGTRTAPPATNLPAPPGPLIGRSGDVAGVRALLEAGRLVTLTGPGGVGKTRLAVEAASDAAAAGGFPDGVWLVELAVLDRGDDPVEAVAALLGLRDDAEPGLPAAAGGGAPLAERLADALRGKRALLVLDNCEHVIDGAARMAARLLAAAPHLRLLATSREPMGISGERLRLVAPLALPPATAPPDPGALRRTGAVRLFEERASAAAPGFELSDGNAAAVAAVCRRLDGIPLALELAATRVRVLGVHELARRLDDRFRLLSGGRRDAPARQRTLRSVIDWSWESLEEDERAVLRRLAVHRDGCTLEAAEEVCSGDGVARAGVLDLLSSLVDRSLVAVSGEGDGHRYRLLESIAAYALERLADAGEVDAVRGRHARYCADLAERLESGLRGSEQCRAMARFDAEAADLRAALTHSAGAADARTALRIANAMAWYGYLRGRLGEAASALAEALSARPTPEDAEARAEAKAWSAGLRIATDAEGVGEALWDSAVEGLNAVADPRRRMFLEWFLECAGWGRGDAETSMDRLTGLLERAGAEGDRWTAAAALALRAQWAQILGDLGAQHRDGAQSAALFREFGDQWGVLQASDVLSQHAEIVGDYPEAERRHREGLRIAETLGLSGAASLKLTGLGRIALLTGDHGSARTLHERAAHLAREYSFQMGIQFAEAGLALLARREGRFDEAEESLTSSLAWNRRADGRIGVAFILAELGFVAEQRGDAATALARQREGYDAARRSTDPRATALALEGLAGAHSLGGDPHHAARLLGAAAAARASVGAPLPQGERADVDRITARVRTDLGEEEFDAEAAAGARRHPDDLVGDRPVRGAVPDRGGGRFPCRSGTPR